MTSWLTSLIFKSAAEIEASGKSIFRFTESIHQALTKNPVEPWETDRWSRGIKRRLIRMQESFFRVGAGRNSTLSFFVRNERDLYVGLRRESITQAATYVSLITDYGYERAHVRFESGWMDVAVYGPDGKALIYAENKASDKTLAKLCVRLKDRFAEIRSTGALTEDGKFSDFAGRPPPDAPRIDDALMKAGHIWRHRPQYFWAVSPRRRGAYRVQYTPRGFTLQPVAKIPSLLPE